MLLDCGEGSYGQIVNHFGDDALDVIRRLKMIFISHLHADHHLVGGFSVFLQFFILISNSYFSTMW